MATATTHPDLLLDGASLRLEELDAASGGGVTPHVSGAAMERVRRSREVVERALRGTRPVYGVNTGFGPFSDVAIAPADACELQRRLVRSHAAGVGPPAADRVVRATMLLRANCLARGHSGARPEVVEALIAAIAHDLVPVVPEQGSVGASGDLAPLAHVALALTGEGEARHGGATLPAAEALRRAGLAPLDLQPKDGLALINGTQFTTAIAALALARLLDLLDLADLVTALTVSALQSFRDAFDAHVHEVRPHPGQARSAATIRRALAGLDPHRAGSGPLVQDAYAIRCAPQVHGAARDAAAWARAVVEIEMNASTDNPLVFAEATEGGSIVAAGNFHAAPVALACDLLAAATTQLATISERRTERLVNAEHSAGLPMALVQNGGLDSGFMLLHVTAAALASECKSFSFPASVDTIPTSGGKEDHVPMAPLAARKLAHNVSALETILAIELLAACQGIDLRPGTALSPLLRDVHARVRAHVPTWREDRYAAGDVAAALAVVRGELRDVISRLRSP